MYVYLVAIVHTKRTMLKVLGGKGVAE